jgi:DNA-binding SARP family transcriptional activator
MQFRVLGPLQVRATDGELVTLRAAKHRALLSVLLLHANELVSVDRLIDALWPARPPPSAASAVRTYVSALRRALRLGCVDQGSQLVAQPGGYRLDLHASDLDLLAFEDFAADARTALAGGDPAVAAERFQAALALWRGRPFEDVPLAAGVESTLDRLDERRLTVLEDWLETRLLLGHHADLVAELRALVAEHPLRERLWGQWMLALYRCGRQAEALGAFRDLRQRLHRDLAIEPGPTMQQLHRKVLSADPSLRPPARPTARALTPVPRHLPLDVPTFTGRRTELAALLGNPAAITAIDGIAGVGKSALAVRRTGSPSGTPTASSTPTCRPAPSGCNRSRRWSCSAGSCARSVWASRTCRRARRRRPSGSAR